MATITSNIISISQGEALTFPIILKDTSGKVYTPAASDVIRFTVKESTGTSRVMLQKAVEDGKVSLTAEETNIPVGNYLYDVELTGIDGYVATVITPTLFIVSDKNELNRIIDLVKLLPPVTKDIKDVIALCESENTELQVLWSYLVELFNNQFIASMTEYGLTQWEKMFDVLPNATDTWADRRYRIQSLLKGTRPFTDEKLEELLTTLCGADGYVIQRDYEHYKITILVNLGVKSQLEEVKRLLDTIIPMNLGLTVDLNYNRHQDLKKLFTHGAMKPYTHKSLREDVLP